jgi:hypothetical protein
VVGCLPVPCVERSVPAIDGRLLTPNGDAVAGWSAKRVVGFTGDDVKHGRACGRAGETTRIDSAGRFHFDGSWRFLPVIPLYGDPSWRVLVCVQNGDQTTPAWEGGHIGRTPPHIALSCRAQREPGSLTARCETEPASR